MVRFFGAREHTSGLLSPSVRRLDRGQEPRAAGRRVRKAPQEELSRLGRRGGRLAGESVPETVGVMPLPTAATLVLHAHPKHFVLEPPLRIWEICVGRVLFWGVLFE